MAKKLIQVVYQVNDAALLKAAGSLKANEDAARKADDQVKKYGKDAEAAGNQAGKSFMNLGNIWKGLIAIGIVTFVGNLAKKTFELGVKQEQLNIAFTTFLGSAEKARKLLAELNKFALVTPFTPDQVNAAAKALLAFGVAGDKIIPTLKLLGDVSAGTGKDLAEMAIIFGQIKSTGRLMGQDLLQLINAGFNPLQVISEKTGTSMKKLKEDMEKGLISFDMVEKAFIDATSAGGLFFNLMEAQSKTVGGVLSSIEGNIDEILKNLFTASSGPVKDFVAQLLLLSEGFLKLSESAENAEQKFSTGAVLRATEDFKEFAKAFTDVNEAGRVANELANTDIDNLRKKNQELIREEDINQDLIDSNNKRIKQLLFEITAVTIYLDTIKKEEEANVAKKTTSALEKQAEALKRLNKLRFDQTEGEPSEKFGVENLFGTSIEGVEAYGDELIAELNRQQMTQLEAKQLADAAEIDSEKQKQDKIKSLKQEAFGMGIDLLGQALMASIDASAKGEKELTAAEKKQAEMEKKITIKRMLITTLLNSVKALGTPPVPNFAAAGLAAAFGLGSVAIAAATPAFAEGVIGLEGPGTGTSDSINANLSRGESVITASATERSRNLLEAINDHRIDDRILKGLKVTAGGVTVNLDNKGVEKAIRDKQEPEYYEQGHFVNKIIKKGDTLKLHIRAKSFSK